MFNDDILEKANVMITYKKIVVKYWWSTLTTFSFNPYKNPMK